MRDKWLRTVYALVIISVWAFLMVLDGLSVTYSAPLVLTPLMLIPAGALFGVDQVFAAFQAFSGRRRNGNGSSNNPPKTGTDVTP